MMEKDYKKLQSDELIRDWTEGQLPSDIDNQVADRLLDFIENDDMEIDVKELLNLHINDLAAEEGIRKRNNWKIFVASVAAASVVLLFSAAIFIMTREQTPQPESATLSVENKTDDNPIAIKSVVLPAIADSTKTEQAESGIKEKPKVASNSNHKRHDAQKASRVTEKTPEYILTETLAELNAGMIEMVDNTMECLSMTNSREMQDLNVIEVNLINALYEIRSLNIDLNFNTENKTTDI